MKIIHIGKLPTETIRKTCAKCNTVFEFEPSETKFVSQEGSERYIVCPTCSNHISVMLNKFL